MIVLQPLSIIILICCKHLHVVVYRNMWYDTDQYRPAWVNSEKLFPLLCVQESGTCCVTSDVIQLLHRLWHKFNIYLFIYLFLNITRHASFDKTSVHSKHFTSSILSHCRLWQGRNECPRKLEEQGWARQPCCY